MILFERYKTSKIVNRFLFAGNGFMPEMHLRQNVALGKSRITYIACGSFTKNKERRKNRRKKRIEIYLSKRTRLSLLSTWFCF